MQIQGKYRCINCFNELNSENEICTCGFIGAEYKTPSHCLMPGTILDNSYYIGRVIGEGGFGITYVGYDENLDMKIAIKEFFLSGINSRNTTISDDIEASVADRAELFETYREKFINEARILAKFNDEDGIVSILKFFKSNNTAYIIMEFLDGETLKEYLKRKNKMSVDETLEVFLPIMKTLDGVHAQKLIHRDISPDNIIFTKKGKVKLLDFGAAREVTDGNKSLSVVLKHGFAPPEQYQSHGNQGPWTDIYALSATIYKCLTGKTPTEAIDRTMGQEIEPVCVITADCPEKISDVIMKGLELQTTKRYQSMGEMAEALKAARKNAVAEQASVMQNDPDATVLIFDEEPEEISSTKVVSQEKSVDTKIEKENKKQTGTDKIDSGETKVKKKATKKKPWLYVLIAIVICAVAGYGAFLFGQSGKSQKVDIDNTPYENEIIDNAGTAGDEENEEGKYSYLKSAEIGYIVEFGNYNGFTTWRVLDKSDNNLLIITENVVDSKPFNEENAKCDWSSCTLRSWLNNDYYNNAFTVEEKELITETDVDGVKDRIYLLSSNETKKYFSSNDDRIARGSSGYAECWWLRSPVNHYGTYCYGSYVYNGGSVSEGIDYRINIDCGVRPILNIDLSNL